MRVVSHVHAIELRRKKGDRTYILNLLLSNVVNALGDLVDLVGLAAVYQGGARGLKPGLEGLHRLESTELGQSSGLLDLLVGNLTSSNLLDSISDVLAGSGDLAGISGKRNSEETGVRVGVALGRDTELSEALGGLGQEREARGPLDGRLATKEGSEDSNLGLVARGPECAGAGEANHDSVFGLVGDALLTTVVLRGTLVLDLVLAGGASGRKPLEELTNPPRKLRGVGAAADESNVGLGVGILGELGESLDGEVFLKRDGGVRGDVVTETAVESQAVGGIDTKVLGVSRDSLLSELEEVGNELVQFPR